MAFSLIQTKELVGEILLDPDLGRDVLSRGSLQTEHREPEFYSALVQFSAQLNLTANEWFVLLSIFRGRILRDDLKIMGKLSENQRIMPIGTEVLASRDGIVAEVEQSFSTVGLRGNFILVRHIDGQISGYFHIQHNSALVKDGDKVQQGQVIALSGMTGQTTLPHLHFVVFNSEQTASVPISFRDVETGVPLAGHLYTSGNIRHQTCL